MKMTVDGCSTHRNVTSKARRFKMKETAKGFQILSAGLYTNHIAAILRELGCNAADSHTTAGNPVAQIRVHLPNTLEPFLSVEDYLGVGLDDIQIRGEYVCPNCDNTEDSDFGEEICPKCGCKLSEANYESGIYTTYFDSDKVEDEEVTGCLGLGSKSPLAYTDQFSVIAVKDGIRNVYSAFLDDDGMPAIVRLYTEETTDHAGVKVEMGVNSDDFAKFQQEAAYVYQWFTTTPEITGVEDFEWPDDQSFLMETDDYGIVDKGFDTYSSGGSTNVLMGNVRYTLNYGDFDYETRQKFTDVETMLLKHGVFLKVPLSEGCDVAASREKLQMTARSVETIKSKLAVAEMDCLVEVQKRIDECTTIWDARILYGELMDKTILGAIAKKSEVEPTWKGMNCRPYVPFTKEIEQTYLDYPRDDNRLDLHGPPQQKTRTTTVTVAKGIKCFLRSSRRANDDIFTKENGCNGVRVADNVRVFVQDITHGSYSAIERFLREARWNENNTTKVVYLLPEGDQLDSFLSDTGLNEVTENVSTLPKAERAKGARGKAKKTAKAVVYCGGRYDDKSSYMWDDHTIDDLDAGGVYVEVHRYNWRAGKLSQSGEQFVEPRILLSHAEANLHQVIGLRKALVAKVKNNPNWVRLDQHIINCVKAKEALADDAAAYTVWNELTAHSDSIARMMDCLSDKDWSDTGILNSLIRDTVMFRDCGTREVIAFKEIRSQYGYLVNTHLDEPVDYTGLIEDLKKRWSTLNESYPMMRFITWNWTLREDKIETVVDYINNVDGYTPKVIVDDEAA